jgi:phosphate transport system protein
MPRSEYQRALEDLQSDVVTMGEVALLQVESALELLQTPDPAKAESVIDGDQTVNEWYLDIEADCIELFALQQPVATDLRVIASSYKITTDLERIGDLATNLAGYAVDADRWGRKSTFTGSDPSPMDWLRTPLPLTRLAILRLARNCPNGMTG